MSTAGLCDVIGPDGRSYRRSRRRFVADPVKFGFAKMITLQSTSLCMLGLENALTLKEAVDGVEVPEAEITAALRPYQVELQAGEITLWRGSHIYAKFQGTDREQDEIRSALAQGIRLWAYPQIAALDYNGPANERLRLMVTDKRV